MSLTLLVFFNLFVAGILAGTEFIVRFGVRAPLNVLEDGPQITLRQALVRTMRIPVPIVFLLTLVSGIVLVAQDHSAPGVIVRGAALAMIVVWMIATFTGTVPINKALLAWQADAPPPDWRLRIRRWERLDTVRAFSALTAFALFLTGAALSVA